jgi:mRNA-binding protein PUF3
MDAVPGVLARNMGSMSGTVGSDAPAARHSELTEQQNRARDYSGGISLNGSTNDRAAQSSNPWGSNIWNTAPASTNTTNTTSRFGFGSTTRESSRPREGSYDATEGKTGSGSLVADSETEWRPSRPLWADTGAAGIPHARSSGVSPARQRSLVQPSSQQYTESSSFFPISRNAAVGSGSSSKTTKPVLDPTSSNFTSTNFASPRQIDSLSNGFASFGFGYQETPQQRPDTAVTSWPDSASVHSPSDERRSVAAPEYFTSSGATSRNGSLPPSRHGAEVAQYSQHIDALSRFAQAAPRQTSSFSYTNGRSFQERSGSMQSETFHTSNRFAVEHEQEASSSHRPSISINGMAPNYSHSSQDSHVARDSYPDAQIAPRTDNTSYRNNTYTPDSYSNGQVSEPSAQFRNFQFDSRSAPNGSGVRQSPFYSHNHSHTHTPPVYDRLNPYSSEQTLSHPNNFALVQNKLAGYQIQQERRNYIPNNQFHQQQYQHILPATQLRHPYAYSFAIPNGMPMSALPPHMAMASMSPMMSTQQPPRGPREQQISDGPGIMSAKLVDFKREQKTSSKRWELPDIYDNVVEFAGDQHGSRFIQLKLETANSEVKEKIFKELESNSLQLMQDVFGNYVIQKFFEHGDQTQKKILAGRMKGHVLALTNQMYACRVVQKVDHRTFFQTIS